MKILLVNPKTTNSGHAENGLFPPLGLAYLASNCGQHEVKIVDCAVQGERFLMETLKMFSPDYVGFYVVTPALNNVLRLAETVKLSSDCAVIAGGPHVSALPNERYPNIDIVVRGEGERTFAELLSGKDLSAIRGLSYRKHDQWVNNPDRSFINNLNSLNFPAIEKLPINGYKGQPALGNNLPIGAIATSRGCPYNCKFCYKSIFGSIYRFRSPENIFSELLYWLSKASIKEWAIIDDTFTTAEHRVHELCDLIIDNNVRIPWSCPIGIRVNSASLDLLKHMKSAGCYRVAVGIENGSQDCLDAIGKRVTLQQIRAAICNCDRAKIKSIGMFILGGPWDSLNTMRQTIEFAKQLPLDYAQFCICTPFPGSEMTRDLKRNGCRLFFDDYNKMNLYDGQVYFDRPGFFDKNDVITLQRSAYREFYLRPRQIIKMLFSISTLKNIKKHIKGMYEFVFKKQKR